jgi:hemolysin III
MSPDRVTLGPLQNPIRALLHALFAAASFALACYFGSSGPGDPGQRLALVVFAASQFALYTASSLYHGAPWTPLWKRRMQRIDHSMIYVKIAGTLTPIAWIGLEGAERFAILGAAWGIAFVGVGQKLLVPSLPERASIPVQVMQATLALPAMLRFGQQFPADAVVLALGGGLLYLVGLTVFLTERPRLWPRVFSHHEVFHLFVVAGSSTHFTLALRYLGRMS